MKTKILFVIIAAFLLAGFAQKAEAQRKSKIQIVLILDTSNSMDGLIEQAKSQLWKVVNELALARYNGEQPQLEIALYEYGNDKLQAKEGFIRKVADLTTDLDKISEDLFSLTTYGGEEYCGYVIQRATDQLTWSKSNDDLKLIFIAGNEPFNQGQVKYEQACKNAIKQGIVVNTIFCGKRQEGINTFWKNGADLADGSFMHIDHNQKTVYIDSPYDDEILEMNQKLNETYIAYGSVGRARKDRQMKQDDNAAKYSKANAVQRSISKSSANYTNAEWDLVDAIEKEEVKVEEIEEEQLPEEMRKMNKKEREEYVKNKQKQRAEIQEKINKLNEKRRQYVAKKKKEMAQENTLDAALLKAVRLQATKRNFTFKK